MKGKGIIGALMPVVSNLALIDANSADGKVKEDTHAHDPIPSAWRHL